MLPPVPSLQWLQQWWVQSQQALGYKLSHVVLLPQWSTSPASTAQGVLPSTKHQALKSSLAVWLALEASTSLSPGHQEHPPC